MIAIPFLGIAGVRAVLDSRSGSFVEEVGPGEAGWVALVEPSSVTVVVEQYETRTTGVTLIVHRPGAVGGAVVVIPGNATVGDESVGDIAPEEVASVLAETLKLRIDESVFLDESTWPELLGETTYVVSNTDEAQTSSGETFAVGDVAVNGGNVAAFVGSTSESAELTVLMARRILLWSAMVDSPADSEHLVVVKISELAKGESEIFGYPVDQNKLVIDDQSAADLVGRVVPFPAGGEDHHRIRLRVLDRTGEADLATITSELAAAGFEIVEMGNAEEFGDGPSELVVPSEWTGPDVTILTEYVGVESVVEQVSQPESVATLLIGDDFSLISA